MPMVKARWLGTGASLEDAATETIRGVQGRIFRVLCGCLSLLVLLSLVTWRQTPVLAPLLAYYGYMAFQPTHKINMRIHGVVLTMISKLSISLLAFRVGSTIAIHYLFTCGVFFVPLMAAVFSNIPFAVGVAVVSVVELIVYYLLSTPTNVEGFALPGITPETFLMTRVIVSVSHVVILLFFGIAFRLYLDRAVRALTTTAETRRRFLSNMNHEIRTPLIGLLGMNEILLTERDLSPSVRGQLEVMSTSGHALLYLINNILDLSRMKAGTMSVDEHAMRVRDIARAVVDLFQAAAFNRGVALSAHVDDTVPEWLRTDPFRVTQVLSNLIGNAIKFTPSGSVRLHVFVAAPAHVAFRVSDTGVGIPPDTLAHLSHPFSQCDSSTTRRYGGSGLGLAVCADLALLLRARLHVASTEGVGSDFTLVVPLIPQDCDTPARDGPLLDSSPVRALSPAEAAAAVSAASEAVSAAGECDDPTEEWRPMSDAVVGEHSDDQRRFWAAQVAGAAAGAARLHVSAEQMALLGDAHGTNAHRRSTRRRATAPETARRAPSFGAFVGYEADGYVAASPPPQPMAFMSSSSMSRPAAAAVVAPSSPPRPMTGPYAPPAPLAALAADGKPPLFIIVAEDNELNALVVRKQIERAGHRCAVFPDGAAALSAFCAAAAPPDLVLLDLHMPDMDGLQAATEMRRAQQRLWGGAVHVPIVALTAADRHEQSRCMDAGMDAFLAKPLTTATLEACFRRFCGRGTARTRRTDEERIRAAANPQSLALL